MWELIDFKTIFYDNGCDVQMEDRYLVRNQETKEQKWVGEYEFNKFRKLGLI